MRRARRLGGVRVRARFVQRAGDHEIKRGVRPANGTIRDCTEEDWAFSVDLNMTAMFRMCRVSNSVISQVSPSAWKSAISSGSPASVSGTGSTPFSAAVTSVG